DASLKLNVARDFNEAETLVGIGILDDAEKGSYTVVDGAGAEHTVTLAPLEQSPAAWSAVKLTIKPEVESLGITRRPQRFPFGHEMLADQGCFYIWYDQCSDHRDKTVAAFIEETIK